MPRKPPPAYRLVTIADAAGEYGLSRRTIERYLADGTLTGWRLGPRMIRVDRNELAALVRPMTPARGGDAA